MDFSTDQRSVFRAWADSLPRKPCVSEAVSFVRRRFPAHAVSFAAVARLADECAGRLGLDLPLGFLPRSQHRFPVLGADDWAAATLLVREACMLRAADALTDKPDWCRKVRDPLVAARWEAEARAMDWAAYRAHGNFTPAMAEACIDEVRRKAALCDATGLVPVYDYSACVVKSDRLLSASLRAALVAAAAPLEAVAPERRDWHPGSGAQVLDLWLPCDVDLDAHGRARIASYVNNLHPEAHAALYAVVERCIDAVLPAWHLVYRWPAELAFQRLHARRAAPACTTPAVCAPHYECCPSNRPLDAGEPPREDPDHPDYPARDPARDRRDAAWFDATHPVCPPDAPVERDARSRPGPAPRFFALEPAHVRTSAFAFSSIEPARRIQVIVKLANIHLTPDKPSYPGGAWHVEGQLNEHICATALFYYDCHNISESRLAFRTAANAEDLTTGLDYAQSDYRSIERTFAIPRRHAAADPDPCAPIHSVVQDIGSVLTRPGRVVVFPNLLQHRVEPFTLADPSHPGHRKILALFLVDPAIPILSTANVPPQQPHWRRPAPDPADPLADPALIHEPEALRLRAELMAERSALQQAASSSLTNVGFNFCEH